MITELALEDLHDIFVYIAENFYSEAMGRRTVNDLIDSTAPLEEFPEIGVDADEKFGRKFISGQTTRLLIVEKYLIWYIIYKKKVNVLRITNQRQDIAKLLLAAPKEK